MAISYIFTVLAVTALVSASVPKVSFWSAAKTPFDEVDDALAFIKCCDKALDGGLESAGIPDHNPLVIRNISSSADIGPIKVTFSLFNNELDDLLVYNISNVKATTYQNPERVYYTYDIYWPSLTFKGSYELKTSGLIDIEAAHGTFSFKMIGVDFAGFWNMTKPNQDVAQHLDDFQLVTSVEDVKATLTGLPTDILNNLFADALKNGINNAPTETVSTALKARFNDFWIAYPDKINAIISNC